MFRKDSITNISNIQLCDYEPGLASIIQSALAGCKLLPDDWALIQESLPANDAVVTLFRQHRQTISRQLVINNKNQLAVPLIYFSHDNQSYVLLMKNIGLTAAAKPEQLQWTAHSTRVDEHEYELMQDDDMWKLCEDMSNGDEITPYYIAAIVRRLKELGIKVSATDIKKIHPIDRIGAGLPESDDHYCTEFFYVNLGERNPEDLMRACHQQTASRFAQWTHCFKMSELQEIKRDATFKPEGKYNERFIFNYEGTNYPIRFTTWSFIKALQLLQEHTILPDGGDKDPWTLQNITSYERALQWVRNRLDSDVQISIFSEKNNWLSSPKLHAYAAKTGINVEHLAYSSLRPERLVLHAIIANLTVKTIVNHKSEFDQQVTRLYRYFFANNPLIMEQWECELQQTRIDSIEDTEKINHIISNIRKIADHYIETGLYHVNESDQDIAEIIVKHDKYHQAILPIIMSMVNNMIDAAIEQGDFKPLTRFPVDKRQCFGVTGPVASGKSSSEELARDELQGQPAAFISSDEWNGLLSANLNISEFNMQRGKLTLAEAWCVKCLIWDMMHKMEQAGSAPNWIQEACDPASIKAPALARTIIYINTSNPIAAVERVKARGLKCGRFVSASATISSYRWPWLNFLSTIEKNVMNHHVVVNVMDTDVLYKPTCDIRRTEAERLQDMNIASLKNGCLEIHNMHRFLSFIERSFRINQQPKNQSQVLNEKQPKNASLLINELGKLFKPGLNLKMVYCKRESKYELSKKDLEVIATTRYKTADYLLTKVANRPARDAQPAPQIIPFKL